MSPSAWCEFDGCGNTNGSAVLYAMDEPIFDGIVCATKNSSSARHRRTARYKSSRVSFRTITVSKKDILKICITTSVPHNHCGRFFCARHEVRASVNSTHG